MDVWDIDSGDIPFVAAGVKVQTVWTTVKIKPDIGSPAADITVMALFLSNFTQKQGADDIDSQDYCNVYDDSSAI